MKPLVACRLHLGYPESGTAQLSSLEAKKGLYYFATTWLQLTDCNLVTL